MSKNKHKKNKKRFFPFNNQKNFYNNEDKSYNDKNKINTTEKKIEEQEEIINNNETNNIICSICNNPIRNTYTAINFDSKSNLVHFDCIINYLTEKHKEKLNKFRKIYYIGNGNFAIVKEIFDKKGLLKTFEIIEKIYSDKNF